MGVAAAERGCARDEKVESGEASEDVATMDLPFVADKGVMEEGEGERERTVHRSRFKLKGKGCCGGGRAW